MTNEGYFRFPTIHESNVVFVSEDDLWSVLAEGGTARRLTSGLGQVVKPYFSPDGGLLAFTTTEEQHQEVFCMPSGGGPANRITFLGANSVVRGWTPDGQIVFSSDSTQPFLGRITELWTISATQDGGGLPKKLSLGPANEISFGPGNAMVLGRNTVDPARWKRYRGGTAGHLWVDAKGNGQFRRILAELNTNIGSPMWVGKRLHFISDHEGIGNIYSCRPDGKDLRRHTDHGEYYARFASSDGTRITYQSGAELYVFDPPDAQTRLIEVSFASPRTQRNRKFVDAQKFLVDFHVHPSGHSISLEARGKAFSMPLWEEAPRQFGKRDGVRYRHGQWLHDGETFVVLSDEDEEESIEVYRPEAPARVEKLDLDMGRPIWVVPSPTRKELAIANHRNELLLVDLENKTQKVLDRSDHARIHGPDWSPDGGWIAYGFATGNSTMGIRLVNTKTKETHAATKPDFWDVYPSFDPEGKYLYFLSYRSFDPVYDSHYFDLGFPRGVKPMLITLRSDLKSPFVPTPKGFGEASNGANGDDKSEKKQAKKGSKDQTEFSIELEGIEGRILALPVPEARYTQIRGIKGKVLLTASDPQGSLNRNFFDEQDPKARIEVYDFDKQEHDTLVSAVNYFKLSADSSTLVFRAGRRLRALKAGEKPDEKSDDKEPGRKSGWIDLNRMKISVNPVQEWNQMLREAWRLMRDHFWVEEMSGVDWSLIYKRYQVLIDKVGSRNEFSDLVWEMQGELGTSHAYEMGGDHREPPAYRIGHLAADLAYDEKNDRYFFSHLVRGDSWEEAASSPLVGPGAGVQEGDVLLAIGGQEVGNGITPSQLLVNQAGNHLELLVADRRGRNPRKVVVKALVDETLARYREWVERSRASVHERTDGRVGYVHVPDMGPRGYSEFHRYYKTEIQGEGLIVDFRFNSGGHVSELILEKLLRKRIGYVLNRWGQPEAYPRESVLGPMVAITNELAGSDGDIASHCFKLLGIGPLVGKRTWGGVIGISPSHRLSDGSLTTQPEHSFWFRDVGFGVENYGTDPDYDVDNAPQDYAAGIDRQLEKALQLVTRELKKRKPQLPDFSEKPQLKLPELPPRIPTK